MAQRRASLHREMSGENPPVHPVHPPESSIATADKYLAAEKAEARHHVASHDLLNEGIPLADKDLAGFFPTPVPPGASHPVRENFPVTQGSPVRDAGVEGQSAQEQAEEDLLKDLRMPDKQ